MKLNLLFMLLPIDVKLLAFSRTAYLLAPIVWNYTHAQGLEHCWMHVMCGFLAFCYSWVFLLTSEENQRKKCLQILLFGSPNKYELNFWWRCIDSGSGYDAFKWFRSIILPSHGNCCWQHVLSLIKLKKQIIQFIFFSEFVSSLFWYS